MEKQIKEPDKFTDEELAQALEEKKRALDNDCRLVKERNQLRDEMLRVEKQRYQSQQSLVQLWLKDHKTFPGDTAVVQNEVGKLHKYVVTKLGSMPVNKLEQTKMIVDLEKEIDEKSDAIDDLMYNIEAKELLKKQEEAKAFRDGRNSDREKTNDKRLQAAEDADKILVARLLDEIKKEREEKLCAEREAKEKLEAKAREDAERAALVKKAVEKEKKDNARVSVIDDNQIVMNICGVNCNLLTFPDALCKVITSKKMYRAVMARTKAGSLVIVCKKATDKSEENVRHSVRDGKTICNIANNSFCTYIRQQYGVNETDEHRFSITYIAYADDIKIRIDELIC